MAYANGKIYILRTHKGDEVYIGSTTTSLEERFKFHKCKSNPCNSKSLFVRYDDVYIELIELFPCETKAQLNRREGQVMLGFGDKAVNKRIAGRTPAESVARWCANNPEKCKEYDAKYYAKNIEIIKERGANYRAEKIEKIKERKAKYYAENQEKINAKQRERYAKKKTELAQSSSASG
jgi:hypothetical protein